MCIYDKTNLFGGIYNGVGREGGREGDATIQWINLLHRRTDGPRRIPIRPRPLNRSISNNHNRTAIKILSYDCDSSGPSNLFQFSLIGRRSNGCWYSTHRWTCRRAFKKNYGRSPDGISSKHRSRTYFTQPRLSFRTGTPRSWLNVFILYFNFILWVGEFVWKKNRKKPFNT